MDMWHFSLLFNLFVIHVMLPFSRSDLNIFALGPLLTRTQAHVNEAYFISAFGYAGILVGGSLWRVRLGFGLRTFFSRAVELPTRGSLFLLRSKSLLLAHGILATLLLTGVLLYYFRISGFGFNLRELLLVTPALRPIAQFTAFYSILIGSFALARYYQLKERSMLVVVLTLSFGLLFYGERGNLIGIIALTAFASFIKLGRRLRLKRLIIVLLGILAIVFILDALRQRNFSPSSIASGFLLSVFYGNSFSDTRDFAVVLSFWDGHHFFGLTYLAGLLAFIPRFLSSFRDTWALGVVTATLVGFKSTEHPGLRVGLFGEAYLNFGLVGVWLLSLFIGATSRLIDLRMKQAVAILPPTSMRVFSYLIVGSLAAVAQNSTGASALYSILLIFLFSWIAQKVARFLKVSL